MTLFNTPPAQAHSQESIDAARAFKDKAPALRRQVLALLYERPRTDEELIRALGGDANSIRPRRVELCNKGFVHSIGTKPGSSGRPANIWAPVFVLENDKIKEQE